jgi:hypothetical protein
MAAELLNYQPEVVVAIKEDRTLQRRMMKRLGPSTQFYSSAKELLTKLTSVETFTAELYVISWNDEWSSWTIRTNDKSDVFNKWLTAQLRLINLLRCNAGIRLRLFIIPYVPNINYPLNKASTYLRKIKEGSDLPDWSVNVIKWEI